MVSFEPILPDGNWEQPRQILPPDWPKNTWERLVLVSLGRKNDFRKPVISSLVELRLRRGCRDYRDRDRILTKPTSETRGGVACGRCSASCVQAMSSEKVSVRCPKNTLYNEYNLFNEGVRMTLYLQNEDCV